MDGQDDSTWFMEYSDLPLPIPESALYKVRHSTVSGRGVFATKFLVDNTLLLDTRSQKAIVASSKSNGDVTPKETTPIAYAILREYRKEVCGECFHYDRGREWKVKLEKTSKSSQNSSLNTVKPTGIVFCQDACRDAWVNRYGIVGIEAFTALEDALRRVTKRSSARSTKSVTMNNTENPTNDKGMQVPRSTEREKKNPEDVTGEDEECRSLETITAAWNSVLITMEALSTMKSKTQISKAERKLLRSSTEPEKVSGDLCYYLLTGMLSAYISHVNPQQHRSSTKKDHLKRRSASSQIEGTTDVAEDQYNHVCTPEASMLHNPSQDHTKETVHERVQPAIHSTSRALMKLLLPSLLALTPDKACYNHVSSTLSLYTSSVLLLYTILPHDLLTYLHPNFAHELNSRASHNAFSIRPSESSDGDQSGEFMGWGVWPAASFFNHSCAPNIGKRRKGRHWEFYACKPSTGGEPQEMMNGQGVSAGEELCITYLGGDEKDLNVVERRKRLREGWGFDCMCRRCVEEDVSSKLKGI